MHNLIYMKSKYRQITDRVRNQIVSVSVLRRRGLPSKRPEGTFSKDRNVLCLIWLKITQVNMTGKIHQTEHLKSELFFLYADFIINKRKEKKHQI